MRGVRGGCAAGAGVDGRGRRPGPAARPSRRARGTSRSPSRGRVSTDDRPMRALQPLDRPSAGHPSSRRSTPARRPVAGGGGEGSGSGGARRARPGRQGARGPGRVRDIRRGLGGQHARHCTRGVRIDLLSQRRVGGTSHRGLRTLGARGMTVATGPALSGALGARGHGRRVGPVVRPDARPAGRPRRTAPSDRSPCGAHDHHLAGRERHDSRRPHHRRLRDHRRRRGADRPEDLPPAGDLRDRGTDLHRVLRSEERLGTTASCPSTPQVIADQIEATTARARASTP